MVVQRSLTDPSVRYYVPVAPMLDLNQEHDQGDPYCVMPPAGTTRFKYYFYHTDKGQAQGSAFTVYGSNDLITFVHLGKALLTSEDGFHWAPSVTPRVTSNGIEYVMLYSRSTPGQPNHNEGHTLHRAVSHRPEGPFIPMGPLKLPEDTVFAIDPDVYYRGGRLKLAYVTEMWDDPKYPGTGIVEVDISDDLSEILSEPIILARPSHPAHLYEVDRKIPWRSNMQAAGLSYGNSVDWHCIEAPVGGLISPSGRDVVLYSCGNYQDGSYRIGAVMADNQGTMIDLAKDGHFVLRSHDVPGIDSVGHPSLVDLSSIMAHGRFGKDQPRQAFIVPLGWDNKDRPIAILN